jgi:hypothetical protein
MAEGVEEGRNNQRINDLEENNVHIGQKRPYRNSGMTEAVEKGRRRKNPVSP